jgi:aminotransferase
LGLKCHKPQGAFYIFPSLEGINLSCEEFANGLLKQEKVAVVPGLAFGKNLDNFIRISYATKLSDLKEAFSRISNYLEKIKR